jgi:hypothetical protein
MSRKSYVLKSSALNLQAYKTLTKDQDVKNNECYTAYDDIKKELVNYAKYFASKVIYCNCDDCVWLRRACVYQRAPTALRSKSVWARCGCCRFPCLPQNSIRTYKKSTVKVLLCGVWLRKACVTNARQLRCGQRTSGFASVAFAPSRISLVYSHQQKKHR